MTPEQRERKRDLDRAYRAAHRDEINARARARYASNPEFRERQRQYCREWRKRNAPLYDIEDQLITERLRDAAWRRFEGDCR